MTSAARSASTGGPSCPTKTWLFPLAASNALRRTAGDWTLPWFTSPMGTVMFADVRRAGAWMVSLGLSSAVPLAQAQPQDDAALAEEERSTWPKGRSVWGDPKK